MTPHEMQIDAATQLAFLMCMIYLCAKAREAVQHLRMIRKNTSPKTRAFDPVDKLTPTQRKNFEDLTGVAAE